MPLNQKGKKIKNSMENKIWQEKRPVYFLCYVENSGKLKGVKKKKIPEINKKDFPYPLVMDLLGRHHW